MIIKKNKVLFILHMPPPIHGSAVIGKYIEQSNLVNESFFCDFINLSTSSNVSNIGKASILKLLTLIKLYFKVVSAALFTQYDICYLTINSKGTGFYKEMVIVFILKILNNKLVYHYHNKGVADNAENWILNKLYSYQFRNSRVILLSRELYYDIGKYLPIEKVYFCPNGIEISIDINLKNLNSKRISKEVVEILFLSHMMKQKGVYVLLEACKILKSKKINFKSIFIGSWMDINETDFSNFITANNLQGNVQYAGVKYGPEKYFYLNRVDILVQPTLNDCFPLVVLEAMQFGLPVISTDETAIPEIVENNKSGFITPKNDPIALAEKIELLINDPSLRHLMGQYGYDKFQKLYKIEKFEENFVQIINQILVEFS